MSQATVGEDSPAVDFNRQVRPLLSDACFHCHGPDAKQRQVDLRLDRPSPGSNGRLGPADGSGVIAPGRPDDSELYRRITSDDPLLRMPPPESGKTLRPEQTALIRRWIEQGAEWQEHWAFIPPSRETFRPMNGTDSSSESAGNPIDTFVLARLRQEGISPAPEADRATLLRRVSFDLTGLPPTPEEAAAFLADDAPDAYEKCVDRLLASPRFGERMAAHWLDLARYADTNGYQNDGERFMWRWREWVIAAFNDDMPFDRFTVEQIAGDLLPEPTLEQVIATGFNRNHRGNAEGGIIPEEYQVEYVVDRVETTGTVWLGLTVGCARCHDHKYDPVSQREFYQLFAYFNNVPESGRAVKFGNSPPTVQAPTPEQQQQLQQLERRLAAAGKRFESLRPELAETQREWERSPDARQPTDWTLTDGLQTRIELDEAEFRDDEPAAKESPPGPDKPALQRAEAASSTAALFDGRRYVDAGDVGYLDKFSLTAWIFPEDDRGGTVLSRMIDSDEDRAKGYGLRVHNGKVEANFVVRWLDDALRVETAESVPSGEWTHVTLTYDGSRVADGVRLYVNGQQQALQVNLDGLNQDFRVRQPFRIGAGGGPDSRFHGLIDDVRIYSRRLSPDDVRILAEVEAVPHVVSMPEDQRSPGQRLKLHRYFLTEAAPERFRRAWDELVSLREEKESFIESFSSVMVMQEMPTPRETFILDRGEYDKPLAPVTPGVPEVLHRSHGRWPPNRLGLARWLVDGENPLTARVAVNRLWEMLFGVGLVKTSEDFGLQGDPASHPELLDWLAVEFQRDWDLKRTLRLMVTSATYRQSSRADPGSTRNDPENRLLARGPRLRLPAEMIRDQALFTSGMLVEELGGPSVRPYQPEGLWRSVATDGEYRQETGRNLYRRSLYTFWKRTVAPPTLSTFDATARETCTVRRARTNTPLQALALLNDVTYVEAARKLAERMMTESPAGHPPLAHGFRLATAREPTRQELAIVTAGFQQHLAFYRGHGEEAEKLLSVGNAPRDGSLPPDELAAYTVTANLILNLDEVVMKE